MQLEASEVVPHLNQVPSNLETVNLWIAGMVAWLNETYDAGKLDRLESFLTTYIVDAINRRLARPDTMLVSESAGPFRAQWSERAAHGGFFLPEEIDDLNRVLGAKGARSIRTAAPARVTRRYGWF